MIVQFKALSTLNNNYSHTENTEDTENACCTRSNLRGDSFTNHRLLGFHRGRVAAPALVGFAERSLNHKKSSIIHRPSTIYNYSHANLCDLRCNPTSLSFPSLQGTTKCLTTRTWQESGMREYIDVNDRIVAAGNRLYFSK